MGSRTIDVELAFLEKATPGEWYLKTKPHAQFDRFFEQLATARLYGIRKIHFTPASGYECIGEAWLINEEGLFILSTYFINWHEFYQKATKKSPWEEAWQKRAEQGEPEQEKKCSVCGHAATLRKPIVHCSDCQAEVCRSCLSIHRRRHEAEKKKEQTFKYCSGCNTVYPNAWHCEHCGYYYCDKCKLGHMVTCSSNRYYEPPKQEAYTLYRCSGCNTIQRDIPMWECKDCHEYYCNKCKFGHSLGHFHTQDGYTRRESGSFTREDLDELLRRMFGQQSYSRANGDGSYTHTFTAGVSNDLQEAFNVLNLSTKATVQEVKRAFKRKAKTEHPDAGGTHERFVALNNAYELALAHAERNEVK